MKQSEIENLKELRAELWRRAAGSESITPGAWAESLDRAIATLERIRWRKVEEEVPEGDEDEFLGMIKLVAIGSGRYYVSLTEYYPNSKNPWNEAKGTRTTHWAYLPELPELPEEEVYKNENTQRTLDGVYELPVGKHCRM